MSILQLYHYYYFCQNIKLNSLGHAQLKFSYVSKPSRLSAFYIGCVPTKWTMQSDVVEKGCCVTNLRKKGSIGRIVSYIPVSGSGKLPMIKSKLCADDEREERAERLSFVLHRGIFLTEEECQNFLTS